MNTKKYLSLLLLILSGFFVLVSLSGVITIWVTQQRITDDSLEFIRGAQTDVARVVVDFEFLRVELDSAQSQIEIFQ